MEEQFELPELQEPLQPRDWSEMNQSLQSFGEAIQSLGKTFAECIKPIAKGIVQVLYMCLDADIPPRWIYMSKYARKYRTRKKYANMIAQALRKYK